jgi:hypothetical protein
LISNFEFRISDFGFSAHHPAYFQRQEQRGRRVAHLGFEPFHRLSFGLLIAGVS